MRKPIYLIIILVILFIPSWYDYCSGESYKGLFVDEKGRTQPVREFVNISDTIKCEYKGNETNIPISKIKSITFLGDGKRTFLIETKEKKQLKVKSNLFNLTNGHIYLKYKYYDEINQSYISTKIDTIKLKQIIFDYDYGNLTKCPKCSRTFPYDYVFCPFDKTELILIKIE